MSTILIENFHAKVNTFTTTTPTTNKVTNTLEVLNASFFSGKT